MSFLKTGALTSWMVPSGNVRFLSSNAMDAEDNGTIVETRFLELNNIDTRIFQDRKILVEFVETVFYLEDLSVVSESSFSLHLRLVGMKVGKNEMTFGLKSVDKFF